MDGLRNWSQYKSKNFWDNSNDGICWIFLERQQMQHTLWFYWGALKAKRKNSRRTGFLDYWWFINSFGLCAQNEHFPPWYEGKECIYMWNSIKED